MLEILRYPDERLRLIPKQVTNFDHVLRDEAIRMYKCMVANKGVGLAAPQVGISKSFFVIQRGLLAHPIIINPSWTKSSDAKEYMAEEGCLSFPGMFLNIKRFDRIDVHYQCVDAKIHSTTLDGYAAHVFQHESDHLAAILLVDH